MRALVTGAAGFVGRHLVPRLARDHVVIAAVRPGTRPDVVASAAAIVEVDLADPTFTDRLPSGVDVIVHLAQAYRPFPDHARTLFAVNAASTQLLADFARLEGVPRFVLASSGSVYAPATEAYREESPTRPPGFDPQTKLIAETILPHYAANFSHAILRLFAPYGPGQVDRMIPRIVQMVDQSAAITLTRGGQPLINPIFIDDLVEVFAQAVEGTDSYTVNVAGPAVVSVRDIAEMAARALNTAPRFQHADTGVPYNLIADTSRMRALFALPELVPPESGIRRFVDQRVAARG